MLKSHQKYLIHLVSLSDVHGHFDFALATDTPERVKLFQLFVERRYIVDLNNRGYALTPCAFDLHETLQEQEEHHREEAIQKSKDHRWEVVTQLVITLVSALFGMASAVALFFVFGIGG